MGVLGYNQKRPTAETYRRFRDELVKRLLTTDSRLTLMIYGSYVRQDYIPGRSDIDGLIIFHDDVIIDKTIYEFASNALSGALKQHFVPFQVSPCDLTTMRDGRFNSYNPHFKEYFAEEGRILLGRDVREEFTYEIPTRDEQSALTFNLRKSRQGLLFSKYLLDTNNYEEFLRRFMATLDATSRATKQVFHMNGNHALPNRFSALEELTAQYPALDLKIIKEIKHLYHHLDELDALYKKPQEILRMWNEAVTFFETLIREYLRKNPKTTTSTS
ncbi:nucleotidyltransferase domain-containing protein [Candidatus Woesearchaeota archaeon]|nr:nucleotidyltransferase domain-containing protein [Candidatus Woesearchaeota archaeon]MBW3016070.1 nucleotidyltransferase domain-containing protein [Candidatus Woesearchaeota archaeon]